MVPLDPSAPVKLPDPLAELQLLLLEGLFDERIDSDWLSHLSQLVGMDAVVSYGESWPSSHEFIADMIVVRIEEELEKYSSHIAEAKLRAHPHIRLVLRDEGVKGELRIRKLTPIGARSEDQIFTDQIPESLISTRVTVRESGRRIVCDPNMAYFSSKLQSERLETLELAKTLRSLIDHPIRVCDPFCGVGPALSILLSEANLVSDVLASDLNPNAVELLFENLRRWDRREYPVDPVPLARLFDDRVVGIADASDLRHNKEIRANWDLLIVNLPHHTIKLLPSLVPLLDRTGPSLIRGRVIVAETGIEEANKTIERAIPPLLAGSKPPSLRIKRDYNSSLRLCSFEAWISPE